MSRRKRAFVRSRRVDELNNRQFDCFQVVNTSNIVNKESSSTEKITFGRFLKKAWLVITGKAETHGNMTSGVFAVLVSIVFRAIACVGFLITLVGIYAMCLVALQLSWQGLMPIIRNIYLLVMVTMILFILSMYSLIMWGASNEIKKEKDKNYIISVFSGVVSFAALVVALVALYQGVS